DQFRYVYQSLAGDGQIVARVAQAENPAGWAKIGVMIRDTLGAGSKHVMVVVTPENGIAMQYRTATNGASTHVAGVATTAPYWVKLVRAGNIFTGYSSPDGSTWIQVGTITMTMSASIFIGLAADSN